MLCPVCNAQPLKGRQTTCSPKCRSAKYRQQKQKRDASQRGAGRRSKTAEARSPRDRATMANAEQLLSSEVDRIVAAIQQLAEPRGAASTAHRVDLREQVTSQAPEGAVGYRLVLPSRVLGDGLRLSPRRSRSREVAWYTLSPFEYPDDLRLCDGHWYHLVWYNAQGRRMRPTAEHGIPALYYFLGPAQPSGRTTADASQPKDAEAGQASPGLDAATPVTTASALPSDAVTPPPAMSPAGPSASLVFMLPPPPAAAPPEAWTQLLSSFPPITVDENILLVDFLLHPEVMLQVTYEEQLAEARARGLPPPREPVTMVGHEHRHHLHALFTGTLVPPHFWARLKAMFAFIRKHGVDVLAHLPVPIPALPESDRLWLEKAITSPPKRTYMQYVCARQEAMLDGQPLPVEPSLPLSSKERNQIRRALEDLRAVMLFKRRAESPTS